MKDNEMKAKETVMESMIMVQSMFASKILEDKKIEITYDDVQKAFNSMVESKPTLKVLLEDKYTEVLLKKVILDLSLELFKES